MEPIGRIDSARMEDHINSNIEPSVPLSVYQELYQVIMVMMVMMVMIEMEEEEEDDDCDQQQPDLCIFSGARRPSRSLKQLRQPRWEEELPKH